MTLVFLEIGSSHTSSHMRLDPGAGFLLLENLGTLSQEASLLASESGEKKRALLCAAPAAVWWAETTQLI